MNYFFPISVLILIFLFYSPKSFAGEPCSIEPYKAANCIRDVVNSAHTPIPSLWTQESRVGDTLYIDGKIQDIQWSNLRDGEYKGIKRIVLNSFGGHVEGAKELAQVIREQGLMTVVPAGGVCMSACTLLFQAGVKRQAHQSAIFTYHAPRSGQIGVSKIRDLCKVRGEEYCKKIVDDLIASARDTADNFFNLFLQYGLDPALKDVFYSLPEETEEIWKEDGN